MRRITSTIVTTLAILVLLFSYRTSRNDSVTATTVAVGSAHVVSGGSASVVSAAAGPDPSTGATAAQITVPSTAPSSNTPPPATAASTTAVRRTSTMPRSGSGSKTTASAPTSSATPATTKVDGSAVSTPYGDVQVEVTITNDKITDVQAVEYPNQERRDQEINADALPQLHAQVLSAQSSDIAGVSGATFTTQGYVGSLQSALDAAHFK